MHLDPIVSSAIVRLVDELSSELDLHYSDSDMPALQVTMDTLFVAVALLDAQDIELPEPFLHLRYRFELSGGRRGIVPPEGAN